MISPVDNFIKDFSEAGADIITFHPEATIPIYQYYKFNKKRRKKSWYFFKTKFKNRINREIYRTSIDLILIMSVEPGFGGQKFMPEVLDKTKKIKELIDQKNLKNRN